MKMQRLLNVTRRAVDEFHMIEPGDKIAVGVSGGKDSLTLLYALQGLQRFYPLPFTLEAVTVDLGFPDMEPKLQPIRELCSQLQVPYTVVPSEISQIVFDVRKEENPCSLCAKLRKGAFNRAAVQLGCNKVAYGHHKDALVETMLMSLIYEGRFHCFSPVTYLDRMQVTVIRPLMYADEADIIGFRNRYQLPVFKNPCPADGNTRREYVKQLVKKLTKENPGCRERLFTAVLNGNLPGWPERHEGRRVY